KVNSAIVNPSKSSASTVDPAPTTLPASWDAYSSTSPLTLVSSLSSVVGEKSVWNVAFTQASSERVIRGRSETNATTWPTSIDPSTVRNSTRVPAAASITAPVASPRGQRCRCSQFTAGSSASARNKEINSSSNSPWSCTNSHQASAARVTTHTTSSSARSSHGGTWAAEPVRGVAPSEGGRCLTDPGSSLIGAPPFTLHRS